MSLHAFVLTAADFRADSLKYADQFFFFFLDAGRTVTSF